MVLVEREIELPAGRLRLSACGHSDRGAVRKLNEDSFLVEHPLFVVADGMGGHAFGDRASAAATGAFSSALAGIEHLSPQEVLETVREANIAVLGVSEDSDRPGAISGTTLAGLAFVEAGTVGEYHWMVFNVGDSRVYSWDGRSLTQLSVDHSAVQELVDLGQITRLEADHHPERNVVTRALGASTDVDADVWLIPARDRQTFLLCSDGLTKELDDDEIARIIVFHASESQRDPDHEPISLAERLVNAAIASGGSDNVTVVIVESDFTAVRESSAQASDETIDRDALPGHLEETLPRS